MPSPIKNYLSSLLPNQPSWKQTLLCQWHTIIGNLNTHVSLEKITDDSITLGVSNSGWMQELYALSPLIMDTVNKNLDQPRIKQVRFKQVCQKKKPVLKTAPAEHMKVDPQLSTHELQLLEQIKEPDLRTAVSKFFVRCKRERS